MRKPQGYATIVGADRSVVNLDGLRCEEVKTSNLEIDTYSCFHCNRVIHVKPMMDPADMGGLCKICMKLICPHCLNQGCVPFEKKLEMMEDRDRTLRSYGV